MKSELIRALFEKHCRGIKGKNLFGVSKMTIKRSSMVPIFRSLDNQIKTKKFTKLKQDELKKIIDSDKRAAKYQPAVKALLTCWPSGRYILPAQFGTVKMSETEIFMSHIIGITFCGDWCTSAPSDLFMKYPEWNDNYYTKVQIAHNNMLIPMALAGYTMKELSVGVTMMSIILGDNQSKDNKAQKAKKVWHYPVPVHPAQYGDVPMIPMQCHESILIMTYACQVLGDIEYMTVIQNGKQVNRNLHYYCVPRRLQNNSGMPLAKEIDQGEIYDLWGYLYDGKPMEGNWIYPNGRPKGHQYHCDDVKVLCEFDRETTIANSKKTLPMNAKMTLMRI